MKILLAPSFELAFNLNPDASVEAEYGENVIEGKEITLAHHAKKYAHNPAPCNSSQEMTHKSDGIILVSHLDLDTIGGCLQLLGLKPKNKKFWDATEFIDLNGVHHSFKLSDEIQEMLNAFWCIFQKERRLPLHEISDVTTIVLKSKDILEKILSGDRKLLDEGQRWKTNKIEDVENCLSKENDFVRVFITENTFCNSSYYSPNFKKIIPSILTLNLEKKSITLSFEDGGKIFSAKEIVQELWGETAGGHPGISGSPRGWNLDIDNLNNELARICNYVMNLYKSSIA